MAEMQRQMGSLTPAQMQAYQQQAAHMNDDDIRRARTQMNSMTPDQFQQAAGQAGVTIAAREKYALEGARGMKIAGNQLHSSKQYAAAIDKYNNVKSSLEGAIDFAQHHHCNHKEPATPAGACSQNVLSQ